MRGRTPLELGPSAAEATTTIHSVRSMAGNQAHLGVVYDTKAAGLLNPMLLAIRSGDRSRPIARSNLPH